jgi:hypothetical protein
LIIKKCLTVKLTKMINVYTCSFCGTKAEGKPLSFLVNSNDRAKVKLDGSSVALMPDGWDWDIVPVKFTDLWSCGCHPIRKTK